MKALVLAGGSGTRMRPITHTWPKQMVPVANKPVLYYVLEDIARTGITDVGVVVGDSASEIQKAVGDGAKFGLDITYLRQDAPRGLAHALLVARDYLGDNDFIMYLGDNFVVGGVADLVSRFQNERPDAQILLTRVSEPSNFGVAEIDDDGAVVRLEEKPAHPKSDLVLAGIYLFTPAIHKAARQVRPSWRDELEITDAIQWLIDRPYDVHSAVITGYWKDTGNAADMLDVNRTVLHDMARSIDGNVDEESTVVGGVRIDQGACIRRSCVVGPAIIGSGAVVSDSYVGPYTSIAKNCRIEDSEIDYSIVLDSSHLHGVRRLQWSLIGRNVTVAPAVHTHMILGDDSSVEMPS